MHSTSLFSMSYCQRGATQTIKSWILSNRSLFHVDWYTDLVCKRDLVTYVFSEAAHVSWWKYEVSFWPIWKLPITRHGILRVRKDNKNNYLAVQRSTSVCMVFSQWSNRSLETYFSSKPKPPPPSSLIPLIAMDGR